MKTLTKLLVPLLLGVLAACGDTPAPAPTPGPTPGSGPVTVSPKAITLKAGESSPFIATVEGTDAPKVLWRVEGSASGSITSTGVYTAPLRTGTYTIIATNALDDTKSDSAEVTVTSAVAVTISPRSPTVKTGGSVAFTAQVTGTSDTSVTWSVDGGSANGTISAEGLYTAPTTPGTYTVIATSQADPTRQASAQVLVGAVTVSINPTSVTLTPGSTTTFTATVTGAANTSVLWSVEGGDANGTITSAGLYTAPTRPGTFRVVAQSATDPEASASATVTVPVAQGGDYTNPTGSGWRLMKNTGASSGNHLVLDLVGPAGESGRGVDLTLSVDAARATWAQVSSGDSEYVANRLFELGAAPRLLKSGVKAGTLEFGVYQKGTSVPATAYSGALVSVALDVTVSASTPAGTRIPLTVVKAHALPATGELLPIDVAVGTLVTQ